MKKIHDFIFGGISLKVRRYIYAGLLSILCVGVWLIIASINSSPNKHTLEDAQSLTLQKFKDSFNQTPSKWSTSDSTLQKDKWGLGGNKYKYIHSIDGILVKMRYKPDYVSGYGDTYVKGTTVTINGEKYPITAEYREEYFKFYKQINREKQTCVANKMLEQTTIIITE